MGQFEIRCLTCGSTNCETNEEIDYDYDENPISGENYIRCNDCGEDDR